MFYIIDPHTSFDGTRPFCFLPDGIGNYYDYEWPKRWETEREQESTLLYSTVLTQKIAPTEFSGAAAASARIMGSLVGLLVPAGLLSLAMFMHILACALYNNWWPLLTLLFYLLMLPPIAALARESESLFEPTSAAIKHWSLFFTSTLTTLIVGVPITMCHLDVVESGAVYLNMAGFVLLVATGAAAVLLGGVSDDGWGS